MRYFVTGWIISGEEFYSVKYQLFPDMNKILKVQHYGHYKSNYDYLMSLGRPMIEYSMRDVSGGVVVEQTTIWHTGQMGNLLPMKKPVKKKRRKKEYEASRILGQ